MCSICCFGSRRHLCHGSGLCRLRAPVRLHQAGAFFVTRAKSNIDFSRLFGPVDEHGRDLRSDHRPGRHHQPQGLSEHLRRIRFKDPETGKTLVFLTNNFTLPALTIAPSTKPLAGGTVLQVDQAAPADQAVLRHQGKRGEDANLDRGVGLRAGRHRQETAQPGGVALHIAADPFGDSIREDALAEAFPGKPQIRYNYRNQLNLFDF